MKKVIRNLFPVAAFLLVIPCAQVLGGDQAEDSSIELEFWQSVKDSDNADMLRAYLDEYPNGKFKSLAKIKIKQLTGSGEDVTKTSNSTSSDLKENGAQEAVSVSESKTDNSLPKTNWCGKSSGSYQLTAQECVSQHGVPIRTRADAEWVSQEYFGKYEQHKAFAISQDSFGLAAYRDNPEEAKHRALLSCNLRSLKAKTCRVINIDGSQANFVNAGESSKPVFSASGNLGDLTGRYRLQLRDSDGMDGSLELQVTGSKISGSVKVCFQGNHCADYIINENYETLRGRYFRNEIKVKINKGARWPKTWQISASFSSDTRLVMGKLGGYVFDGKKYSE